MDESIRQCESIERWPCPWNAVLPRWLGDIKFCMPLGASRRPTFVGLISSHSHRNAFMQPEWEKSLEAALAFAKNSRALPLFASTTPYADRLRHACQRFAVPYVELRTLDTLNGDDSCSISIGLDCSRDSFECDASLAKAALEDRAIAILSQTLFALHVRGGGTVERLIRARLNEPSILPGTTIVAFPNGKSHRLEPVEERLADLGAVLWLSNPSDDKETTTSASQLDPWSCHLRTVPSTLMPWSSMPSQRAPSDGYLVHCTRARQGAWPDQSQSEYFDEAIRFVWGPAPSPIDALARILAQQRLVATHRLRRGQFATVCFSGRQLSELLAMRSFQSHLARWDWEPYGIAIRRDWLSQHGAQPVAYLSRKEIERVPNEQLPFVQPTPHSAGGRDWRVEQEWRVVGDVRLNGLDVDQAFVFVPSPQEARLLAPLSRWPIVVLEDPR